MVVQRTVESIHAKNQDVTRAKLGREQSCVAPSDKGNCVGAPWALEGGLRCHRGRVVDLIVLGMHRLGQIEKLVGTFDQHQRAVGQGNIAQRNPDGIDPLAATCKERMVVMQSGRPTDRARTQPKVVLGRAGSPKSFASWLGRVGRG